MTPVLWRLLRTYRWRLAAAMGLQALAGLCSLLPWMLLAWLAEPLARGQAQPALLALVLLAVLAWLGCQALAAHLAHRVDADLCNDLRLRLLAHLQRLPLDWFGRQGPDGVARLVEQDVRALHQLIAHAPNDLSNLLVVPLVALLWLAWLHPWLLLFCLLPLVLAAAGFTILTTEFVIVGLLPALAADLQVSVAQAGLLVSLFAFSVAAFGPFLTAALAGVERKRLFVACLLLFAAANALAAVAGDIWTMAVARFVPALALPVFWAMASETAAHLAGPSREGRAVALVFFGIVAATVLGIPIGTLIADAWGWRLAFAALAALALAKALLLAAWLPRIPGRPGVSLRSQASVLRQPLVLGHLLLSLLVFTGMFTPYTYLADILQRLAGFSGSLVGWTLMGFGAVGLLGNWLGGRLVDRSPLGATLLFVLLMALGMLALVPTLGNAWLLAATLATWGVAQAALFIVGQVRVMKSAPRAPAFAASLNISACNAGIGIGALAGSRVIDGSGLAPLGEVGALVCLAAMAVALLLMLAPRQAATEPSLGGHIPH